MKFNKIILSIFQFFFLVAIIIKWFRPDLINEFVASDLFSFLLFIIFVLSELINENKELKERISKLENRIK